MHGLAIYYTFGDKAWDYSSMFITDRNEKNKRQQDETSNIPLTGTKEADSVDSLGKSAILKCYF
jgi:hypothetical protein